MKTSRARFDRDYYRRFYFEPRTAVISAHEMSARARLIGAYVEHIGLPVRRILDAGCGIGLLRRPLARLLPRATYIGLEASEYLCKRYGWQQGLLQSYPRLCLSISPSVMTFFNISTTQPHAAHSPTSDACAAECCISLPSPLQTGASIATANERIQTCICAKQSGTARDCGAVSARPALVSGCGVTRRLRYGNWRLRQGTSIAEPVP